MACVGPLALCFPLGQGRVFDTLMKYFPGVHLTHFVYDIKFYENMM